MEVNIQKRRSGFIYIGVVAICMFVFTTGVIFAQSSAVLEDEIRASFEREGFDTSDDELIQALAVAAAESGVTSEDFAPLPPAGYDGTGAAFAAADGLLRNSSGALNTGYVPLMIGVSILFALAILVALWRKLDVRGNKTGLQNL